MTFRAWMLIAVAYAFLAIGAVITQLQNRERVREIQDSRTAICEDDNRRHDNTVRQLEREYQRLSPDEREAARETIEADIRLVETFLPKQDCARFVEP